MHALALRAVGPYAALGSRAPDAVDGGRWTFGYLMSRATTIGAGTAEIQRNTIAESVLGLPSHRGEGSRVGRRHSRRAARSARRGRTRTACRLGGDASGQRGRGGAARSKAARSMPPSPPSGRRSSSSACPVWRSPSRSAAAAPGRGCSTPRSRRPRRRWHPRRSYPRSPRSTSPCAVAQRNWSSESRRGRPAAFADSARRRRLGHRRVRAARVERVCAARRGPRRGGRAERRGADRVGAQRQMARCWSPSTHEPTASP